MFILYLTRVAFLCLSKKKAFDDRDERKKYNMSPEESIQKTYKPTRMDSAEYQETRND